MKKLLAILFAVLLAFSCFTVAMVSAEAAPLVQSGNGFNNWSGYTHSKHVGTPYTINGEVATISADASKVGLNSPVFELVPGKQYEISLALRVNSNSIAWIQTIGGKEYSFYPTIALFEVADQYNVGDKLVNNELHNGGSNDYSYSYEGAKVNRPDLVPTWQVQGLDAVERPGWSFVDWTGDACFTNILPEGTSFEEQFSKDAWRTVTCTFTAIAGEEGETAQKVSLGLGFSVGVSQIVGMAYDVKDVVVKDLTAGSSDEGGSSDEESAPLLPGNFENWTKFVHSKHEVANNAIANGDVATITADVKPVAFTSPVVELVNGKKYELSFALRVNSNSAAWKDFLFPTVAIFEPGDTYAVGDKLPYNVKSNISSNDYAYSFDNGSTTVKRTDFVGTWEIGDYAPVDFIGWSFIDCQGDAAFTKVVGEDLFQTTFTDWVNCKLTFTAIPDEEGETSQKVALSVGFSVGSANVKGSAYDIKNVVLKEVSCTHEHTVVKDNKDATCTEDGYTGDTYCNDCGKKVEEGKVVPAGHKLSKVAAVEATHEAAGNKEHYACSVCKKLFSDAEGKTEIAAADVVVDKIAHVFGEEFKNDANNHWKECECGAKAENAAHTFGDWKVTKEATETEKGAKEKACSVCGYKVEEEIPVVAPEVDKEEADKEEADKEEADKEEDKETTSPETGDSTNVVFVFALLMAAAFVVVTTAKKASVK